VKILVLLEGDLARTLTIVDDEVGDQLTQETDHRTGGEKDQSGMDERMSEQDMIPRYMRDRGVVVLRLCYELTLKGVVSEEMEENQDTE
jgi:hypothetical protein